MYIFVILFYINKTDRHDITEILLKMVSNTATLYYFIL